MPVVTIEALPQDPQRVESMLAGEVAAVVDALSTVPENVWAHFVPMQAVYEQGRLNDSQGYHPIVTVLANPRPDAVVARGLEAVAAAVVRELGCPADKVWVHWVDLPPGRVFSAGQVR